MAAVLQAVVDDLRGSVYRRAAGFGASTDRRRRRAAVAYVARRDREWPFSFENLCDSLSLDPGRLRRALGRGPTRGTRILCGDSGAEITVDGEEDLSLREEDVLGIVEA